MSARDDDVAALKDAPYGRDKPRPEDGLIAAEAEATSEQKINPLELSGANAGLSKPSSDMLTAKYVAVMCEKTKQVPSGYGKTIAKGAMLRAWKETEKGKARVRN